MCNMLQMPDLHFLVCFFFFSWPEIQRTKLVCHLGLCLWVRLCRNLCLQGRQVAPHSFQICSQEWLRSGWIFQQKWGGEKGSILRRLFNLKVSWQSEIKARIHGIRLNTYSRDAFLYIPHTLTPAQFGRLAVSHSLEVRFCSYLSSR